MSTLRKTRNFPRSEYSPTWGLCQFLYFKRIIWSKNDRAFTSVPDSAGASRINEEDAPNPREILEICWIIDYTFCAFSNSHQLTPNVNRYIIFHNSKNIYIKGSYYISLPGGKLSSRSHQMVFYYSVSLADTLLR